MSTEQVRSSARTAPDGQVVRLVVMAFVASLIISLLGIIPAATVHASTVQSASTSALSTTIASTRTSTAVRTHIVAHRARISVHTGARVIVTVGLHTRATATVTVTRAGRSLAVTQAASAYTVSRVSLRVPAQPTWDAYVHATNATVVKARTLALSNARKLSDRKATTAAVHTVSSSPNVQAAIDALAVAAPSLDTPTPTADPTTSTPTPTPTVITPTPTPSTATSSWLSGASGDGASSGAFGTWRGSAITVGGTWNDSLDAQTNQWSIQSGAEWGSWNGALDVAVGAIYKTSGETWAAAAAGAYDARWTTALNNIKKYWGTRDPANLYLRFAHEFNGSWTPWNVTGAETASFKTAWIRFHTLQTAILPTAHLVFCPNDGSTAALNLDWRNAFPGAAYVDVLSTDSYNQYPWVNTAAAFASKINAVDSYGAPVGIEKHRQFATSVGLPFAISEWGTNASMGDAPVFVDSMKNWFASHAGTGAGQLVYEIYFNVVNYNNGVFSIYNGTRQPKAADAYVTDF